MEQSDAGDIAIALLTASQANDTKSMVAIMNDLTVPQVSQVIVALTGLAASFLDHLCVLIDVTPEAMLAKLGVQNAMWPDGE